MALRGPGAIAALAAVDESNCLGQARTHRQQPRVANLAQRQKAQTGPTSRPQISLNRALKGPLTG